VRSVSDIDLRISRRISQWCFERSPLTGELKADESWFGARRLRGKRGRGAYGKTIVFGLLKRGDCASTRKLSSTPAKPRCKPLSGAKPTSTASSTQTAGTVQRHCQTHFRSAS